MERIRETGIAEDEEEGEEGYEESSSDEGEDEEEQEGLQKPRSGKHRGWTVQCALRPQDLLKLLACKGPSHLLPRHTVLVPLLLEGKWARQSYDAPVRAEVSA